MICESASPNAVCDFNCMYTYLALFNEYIYSNKLCAQWIILCLICGYLVHWVSFLLIIERKNHKQLNNQGYLNN